MVYVCGVHSTLPSLAPVPHRGIVSFYLILTTGLEAGAIPAQHFRCRGLGASAGSGAVELGGCLGIHGGQTCAATSEISPTAKTLASPVLSLDDSQTVPPCEAIT